MKRKEFIRRTMHKSKERNFGKLCNYGFVKYPNIHISEIANLLFLEFVLCIEDQYIEFDQEIQDKKTHH